METHLVVTLPQDFGGFCLSLMKSCSRVFDLVVNFRLPLLLNWLVGCHVPLTHTISIFWLRLPDQLIVFAWHVARAWLDVVDGELLAVCRLLHVLRVLNRALKALLHLHRAERGYGFWIDVRTIFRKLGRKSDLSDAWPIFLFFISLVLLAWTLKLV